MKHDLIGRVGPLSRFVKELVLGINDAKQVRVLDVGAFDRALGRSLAQEGLGAVYHSVDIDPSHPHEFRDIREVTENYDLVVISNAIEQMSLEAGHEVLHRGFELLSPGGKLYVDTPNPINPIRFFQVIVNRQFWPPADLFAMLRHVGFRKVGIEMYGLVYRPQLTLKGVPRACLERFRELTWRAIGLETRIGLLAIAKKG